MSFWIDLYRTSGYRNLSLVYEGEEFLEYCKKTKGKNVPFYDDITLEEIPELEIKELEEKSSVPICAYVIDNEIVKPIKISQFKRKYKPRLPINSKLRAEIYEKYNHKCHMCGTDTANQIHHIDGNGSNNDKNNLMLVCYDCHLRIEGKKKFKVRLR